MESIDDLKKLVQIAARLKELNLEFSHIRRARQEQREETGTTLLPQLNAALQQGASPP